MVIILLTNKRLKLLCQKHASFRLGSGGLSDKINPLFHPVPDKIFLEILSST